MEIYNTQKPTVQYTQASESEREVRPSGIERLLLLLSSFFFKLIPSQLCNNKKKGKSYHIEERERENGGLVGE